MSRTTAPSGGATLRRSLTTPKIVFVIVAAAAPLTAMVGTVPLAFAIGNGAGVPAAYAFAGLTLLCFSVGYAAMSRRVVNTGGFYTYMAHGLGRPPAVAGGLIAVIAYNTATIGMVGALGYFAQLIAASHGLHLPWVLWSGGCVAVVGFLGYREIEISARLLSVLMVSEIAILVLLDLAIGIDRGAAALPAASFSPDAVLGAGLGVAMLFGFMSFIGFESAALYGEEAPNPQRSVPLATYASVLVLAVFYTLTSWAAVGAVGVDRLVPTAQQQLGDLFFTLSGRYLNGAATTVLQVLLCTSFFAAVLAWHNATNRYMYVLGREGVLPSWLGGVHRRHGSPHRASLTQTAVIIVVATMFAIAGLDPYVNLATSMLGLGTLGIIVLQGAAALSVLGFFRGRPDRHWWRTGVAPLLGLAGLTTAVVLLVAKFRLVTGTTSTIVNLLPWVLPVVAAGGVGYALWMKRARPERYARLGAPGPAREDETTTPATTAAVVAPDADADADADHLSGIGQSRSAHRR